MKRILLLLLLLLPFIVNAETCNNDKITIENITVVDKTNTVEELEAATANGKNINLNLSMSTLGDNINYKIIVKNESKDDYEIDENSFKNKSDYVDYTINSDDNSNVVKANSTKTLYLNVKYKTEVPNELFETVYYSDSKTMSVNMASDRLNLIDALKNPETAVQSYILIFAIILLGSSIILVLIRKNKKIYFVLILSAAIIIPLTVKALCKCEINVNSNVQISKPFDGNGTIYTDTEFYTSPIHPVTGESMSFLSQINYKPKWCYYTLGEEDTTNDYCVYNTKQECDTSVDNTYCYYKTDDSWNSCIDGPWTLGDEATCTHIMEDAIAKGEAAEGEYGCMKDPYVGCRKGKAIEGDYTQFRKLIKRIAFYKYETENYIINKSELCFVTDKDICFSGDPDDLEENYELLKQQEYWFNEHNGRCNFDETSKTGTCRGGGFDQVSVNDFDIEIHFEERTEEYITVKFYCIENSHSVCGD